MLEQQSAHHMLQHLPHPGAHAGKGEQTGQGEQGRKVVVVSLAALAAHYKITPLQAFRKLTSFLHSLGVAAVFDTSASRDVALIEACHEFVCAFRRHTAAHATTALASAPAGTMNGPGSGQAAVPHASSDDRAAAGATPLAPSDMVPTAPSTAGRESSVEAAQESGQSAPPNATPPPIPTDSLPHLPVLASACPGWVCYAEKAHGEYILPHMSRVKSAQQTMGALLKRFYASQLTTTPEQLYHVAVVMPCYNKKMECPEQLYHVAVMPCYDKKLEAARDDFLLPGGAQASAQDGGENTRDAEGGGERLTEVDCVLTSGEIFALLQEQGVDFMALEEHPLDSMLTNVDASGHLYGVAGGSGGYAEALLRYAALELFGVHVPPGPLEWQAVRNADMRECSVALDGQPVLRVAGTGGLEVQEHRGAGVSMGCLNGGGQRPPEQRKAQPTRSYLQDLEAHYLAQVRAHYLAQVRAHYLAQVRAHCLAQVRAHCLAQVRAHCLAQVRAHCLAQVRAHYLAQVRAHCLAQVRAHCLAQVRAHCLAQVRAHCLAQVRAHCLAQVRAHCLAQVRAHCLAQVRAHCLAQVRAHCLAQVRAHCLAQVRAHCLAQARAHCLAQARAHCLAQGRAHCLAQVRAHCLAQVRAHCLAQVRAHYLAQVRAHYMAQVRAHCLAQVRAHCLAQVRAHYLAQVRAHYMAQISLPPPFSHFLPIPSGLGPFLELMAPCPFANPLAQQIYSQLLGSPLSPSAQAVLHTSFHARPKTLALSAPTLAASW
ncbi:unnamed protein product [Closterium sp. Naga37s-1]|nr:unnamed protein product [Closterium sp. Naga37s-1]